jgi:hypothetical protein
MLGVPCMSLKRKQKEVIAERRNPGDPEPESCSPGSIEQQLDMCEEGSLKGDNVSHRIDEFKSTSQNLLDGDPPELDSEINTFDVTMAERDREGSEYSGDDHSCGLQGGET